MNAPFDSNKKSEVNKNPLVNYLKIFQNQHRVITLLYKGLIISFLGFVFLLSFLIFTVFGNNLIPLWGKVVLAAIDMVLLVGVIKAFFEFGKYKKKSVTVLNQVYDYLKNDLAKFEKIKSEHQALNQSHNKLQNKILSFSNKSKRQAAPEYQGWDSQTCPKCKASLEMLLEVCPQCHYSLGKTYSN